MRKQGERADGEGGGFHEIAAGDSIAGGLDWVDGGGFLVVFKRRFAGSDSVLATGGWGSGKLSLRKLSGGPPAFSISHQSTTDEP